MYFCLCSVYDRQLYLAPLIVGVTETNMCIEWTVFDTE